MFKKGVSRIALVRDYGLLLFSRNWFSTLNVNIQVQHITEVLKMFLKNTQRCFMMNLVTKDQALKLLKAYSLPLGTKVDKRLSKLKGLLKLWNFQTGLRRWLSILKLYGDYKLLLSQTSKLEQCPISLIKRLFASSSGEENFMVRSKSCLSRGVMVKAMDCGIVVREFVLPSRYYVHFRANALGKGMNLLILPAMG